MKPTIFSTKNEPHNSYEASFCFLLKRPNKDLGITMSELRKVIDPQRREQLANWFWNSRPKEWMKINDILN